MVRKKTASQFLRAISSLPSSLYNSPLEPYRVDQKIRLDPALPREIRCSRTYGEVGSILRLRQGREGREGRGNRHPHRPWEEGLRPDRPWDEERPTRRRAMGEKGLRPGCRSMGGEILHLCLGKNIDIELCFCRQQAVPMGVQRL
jgi:hypothetical protein